eukprot:2752821-Prymnesium_polylepis.1
MNASSCAYGNGKGVSSILRACAKPSMPSESVCCTREKTGGSATIRPCHTRRRPNAPAASHARMPAQGAAVPGWGA